MIIDRQVGDTATIEFLNYLVKRDIAKVAVLIKTANAFSGKNWIETIDVDGDIHELQTAELYRFAADRALWELLAEYK